MVGGGKDREEMRLIDIDDERFWDVLFDEACVEGNQAERIKAELEKIVAFDTEKVVEQLEERIEITWEHDYRGGRKDAFNEAIDIVKKGGGNERDIF